MKIKLFEISEDGKQFNLDRKTAELNDTLSDLIGENPYNADFTLRPINNKDFELTGTLKTSSPQECSKCGQDFQFPIHVKLYEVLIPKQHVDKNGKFTKPNHILEGETESVQCTEVEQETFDAGEFIHESIGLAIPFNPAHKAGDADCQPRKGSFEQGYFQYDEPMEVQKVNPFAALKDLKPN